MPSLREFRNPLLILLVPFGWFAPLTSAGAGETLRCSVSTGGTEAGAASGEVVISAHGLFVAFASDATNLVGGDTNAATDVFVRDVRRDSTVRVSITSAGAEAAGGASGAMGIDITPNGRYVAFQSAATNLVTGDTNDKSDIFVIDRDTDNNQIFDQDGRISVVRISVSTAGTQGNDDTFRPSISSNGRFVTFASFATNLVTGDGNGSTDVFVRDRDTDDNGIYDEPGKVKTIRTSVTSAGQEPSAGFNDAPSISASGRYIAFVTASRTFSAQNDSFDICVHDRDSDANGTFDEAGGISTSVISVDATNNEADWSCFRPSISADGRSIAYYSKATNLVTGDTNGADDVFIRDRVAGTTLRVSTAEDGSQGNGLSQMSLNPNGLSVTGRFVAFVSTSSNLATGANNGKRQVIVRDRDTDRNGVFDEAGKVGNRLVSLSSTGTQADDDCFQASVQDGGYASFLSKGANLIAADANALADVFAHILDEDDDGLPDLWETAGIDYDLDGVVDVALVSGNPRHKNLYVEADAMVGRVPAAAAITSVVTAFGAVPNALVGNPDGNDGLTLTLTLDETNIPLAAWNPAWPGFDGVKTSNFGTAAERTSTKVLAAKGLAYRYCVFADTHSGGTSSGLSELPGDDFMVTLGGFATPGGTQVQQEGTFMHEFGHNLGLFHGGDQEDGGAAPNFDRFNYKPNYHSVMNYAWQFPVAALAGWTLDYSRSPFNDLDETALDETAGIGAPAGHAAHQVYTGPPPAKTNTERAAIDWNRNGVSTNAGVAADVNRIRAGLQASAGDVLHGVTDWSRLRYRIGGNHNFAVSTHEGHGGLAVAPEMTSAEYDSLLAIHTTGVEDLFKPGSELDLAVAPNPTARRAVVSYSLPKAGHVVIEVLTVAGQRVRTLASGSMPAGPGKVTWDLRNEARQRVAAGVYFVRIVSPSGVVAKRVTVVE